MSLKITTEIIQTSKRQLSPCQNNSKEKDLLMNITDCKILQIDQIAIIK